ncbi:hypothetical protein Tco_1278928, partial [Tanacetum coccineum]
VRMLQKPQGNGQNQTNTDTGTDRVQKSQKFLAKGHLGQQVNSGQTYEDKIPKYLKQLLKVKP